MAVDDISFLRNLASRPHLAWIGIEERRAFARIADLLEFHDLEIVKLEESLSYVIEALEFYRDHVELGSENRARTVLTTITELQRVTRSRRVLQ